MRVLIPLAVLAGSGCLAGSPGPAVTPRVSTLAIVMERTEPDLADSLVQAVAGPGADVLPYSTLASLPNAQRWQRLAVEAPEVDAILTLTPGIEPPRGQAWNEGSTARLDTKRSWRRFSARLVGRDGGRVLWSETFSNGPPVNGFLPTGDRERAMRLVLDELRTAGVLR